MEPLFFDAHTTTPPDAEVVLAMLPYLKEHCGVPTAPAAYGQSLLPKMQKAYDAIYAALGAEDEATFILTSSGAEAVNQVIFSAYFDISRETGKNHFVTTNIEEAPMIMAQNRLERLGCAFDMAAANSDGVVTRQAVLDVLTPRTALVSISVGNGLIGTLQPYQEIIALCQERGVLCHLDISHALGKCDFDFTSSGADFVTFSGDLIHGPRASGGVFVRTGLGISPLIVGGNEQGRFRGGQLDLPALFGLAKACDLALARRDTLSLETLCLRDQLEQRVLSHINNAASLFCKQRRLPHITALHFPHVSNEALMYLLNERQLFASFGGGQFQQISHLLKACHQTSQMQQTTVSFALSHATTQATIDEAVGRIVAAYTHLSKCMGCHE